MKSIKAQPVNTTRRPIELRQGELSANQISPGRPVSGANFNPIISRRLDELDSLRGLAAISVVFGHFRLLCLGDIRFGSLDLSGKILRCLLQPFCAGHEAVMLFFIISGFVLSIPAIDLRAQTYREFVLRRIFRIYFPYLVALTLAILGDLFLHGPVTQNAWLNYSWNDPVTLRMVMDHVLFIGSYNSVQFNPPIWSLILEMRISLMFPPLCALAIRMRPDRLLGLATCIFGTSVLAEYLLPAHTILAQINETMHYIPLFMLGIYLARQKNVVSRSFVHVSSRIKVAIAILSALLYWYGDTVCNTIFYKLFHRDLMYLADGFTAAGATGILVLSLNSTLFRRILLWRPVFELGKMSYSVYLLHFIIMLAAVHLFFALIPLPVICSICFVVTIFASWNFYRSVEIPFMNLGRRLSRSL